LKRRRGAPMGPALPRQLRLCDDDWPTGQERFRSMATSAPRSSSGRSSVRRPPNSWPGMKGSWIMAEPMPPPLQ
jgi:hypothetical protein